MTDATKKFLTDTPGGTSYDRYTTLQLTKNNNEYWVVLAASDSYQDYAMIIAERRALRRHGWRRRDSVR